MLAPGARPWASDETAVVSGLRDLLRCSNLDALLRGFRAVGGALRCARPGAPGATGVRPCNGGCGSALAPACAMDACAGAPPRHGLDRRTLPGDPSAARHPSHARALHTRGVVSLLSPVSLRPAFVPPCDVPAALGGAHSGGSVRDSWRSRRASHRARGARVSHPTARSDVSGFHLTTNLSSGSLRTGRAPRSCRPGGRWNRAASTGGACARRAGGCRSGRRVTGAVLPACDVRFCLTRGRAPSCTRAVVLNLVDGPPGPWRRPLYAVAFVHPKASSR